MGLPYACNTPLTFLYKNHDHQHINTCHGGVTLEFVLNVCFPAKADIQQNPLNYYFRLKADARQKY